MPNYQQAPREAVNLIADRITDHYPHLAEAEVKVGCLFALPTREGAPALKLHGYPCCALIRIVSLRDRVAGQPDAQILIDGSSDGWPSWSHEERCARIDHELEHLTLLRDAEGQLKADDHGRPKLKNRPHDWQLGGFAAIAKRHGEHAVEVQAVRLLADAYGQLLFDWPTDSDNPTIDMGKVLDKTAAAINAGAMGPGVTACPTRLNSSQAELGRGAKVSKRSRA